MGRIQWSIVGAVAGGILGVVLGTGGPVLEFIGGAVAGYVLIRHMKFFPVALVVLTVTGCVGTRVDETQFCTETRFGNVSQQVMPKGWNWQIAPGLSTTCFPATQQVYPGGLDKDDKPNAETVSALTRDSVDLTVEFAFEHHIAAETYYDSVFKTKRNDQNFHLALSNAAREGARSAIGNVANSGAAFNNREAFGDSVKKALQRSLGGLTHVTRVYIRDMDLPQTVRSARETVYKQNLAKDQALKQRVIDSVGNVTRIQNAETDFRVAAAKARVYTENKALGDLEVKKAQAAALGDLCGQATTCIVGGNVMDKFMAGN